MSTLHGSATPSPTPLPEKIGRYKILRECGRGGMGTVYEGEQDSPRRSVALKLVHPGTMSEEMVRRFQLEAEILGRLQHPAIAQIYEAGVVETASGEQPYFAMELIRGRSLDAYVREEALDLEARLELLAKICDGVQHAHQRGVIHRDLKPGNILVDEAGQPKILDFGIARATDADIQAVTLQTDIGQIIGTIPYMSPEQALGDPERIDTRTDIYSLGVVAYETLTETMPYDLGGLAALEALRVVREQVARPISQTHAELRGDVETIVGKALEKEADRRYESASDFAADLRRFLRHEPILARPPSAGYQLRVFARRNKVLVFASVVVLLSLIVGLVGTSLGFVRASEEAARANQSAAFFRSILDSVNPAVSQGRDTTLLKEILDETAARIDSEFAGQPRVEADIRGSMTAAYHGISEFEAALAHSERTAEIYADEFGEDHPRTLAEYREIGSILGTLGRDEEGERLLRSTLETALATVGEDHVLIADLRQALGVVLVENGRLEEATPLLEEALRTCRSQLGDQHASTLIAINSLGLARRESGRVEEALALVREAVQGWQETLGPTHPETIRGINNLGVLSRDLQRLDEAEAYYRDALEGCRQILGGEHELTILSVSNLAKVLSDRGEHTEALELRSEAVRLAASLYGAGDLRTVHEELKQGEALLDAGRSDQAEPVLRRVLAVYRREMGPESMEALYAARIFSRCLEVEEEVPLLRESYALARESLGDSHEETILLANDLAVSLMNVGRFAEAVPVARRVVETRLARAHPDPIDVARSRYSLGFGLASLDQFEEAAVHLGESLVTFLEAWGTDADMVSRAARQTFVCLEKLPWPETTEPVARALLRFHRAKVTPGSPQLTLNMALVAEALTEEGQPEEAVELLEESLDQAIQADTPIPARTWAALGQAMTALGDYEAAEGHLIEAWESSIATHGSGLAPIATLLAELYEAWEDPEQARSWRDQAAGDD